LTKLILFNSFLIKSQHRLLLIEHDFMQLKNWSRSVYCV